MRSPEAVTHRSGGGCLLWVLAVIGVLALVSVAGLGIGLLAVSRPGSASAPPVAAPTPAADTSAGGPGQGGGAPPSDLAGGESWVSDLDLRTARYLSDDLDLRDVHVRGSGARTMPDGSVRARILEVDAVVPFAVVERRSRGVRLGPAGDGLVRATLPLSFLGRTMDVTADAEVKAEGDRIALDPVRVGGGGPLDGLVRRLAAIRQPVPGLPEGMSLTSITVMDSGFAVHASGRDVTISR